MINIVPTLPKARKAIFDDNTCGGDVPQTRIKALFYKLIRAKSEGVCDEMKKLQCTSDEGYI